MFPTDRTQEIRGSNRPSLYFNQMLAAQLLANRSTGPSPNRDIVSMRPDIGDHRPRVEGRARALMRLYDASASTTRR